MTGRENMQPEAENCRSRKESYTMIGTRTVLAAVLAAALAVGGSAFASTSAKPAAPKMTKKYSAALNVGQETGVVKSTKRGASGRFTATLNGTSLTYSLTFTHLSGPAIAAHIHGPAARNVAAGVLVGLCGPCTSPTSGTVTLSQAQIALMDAGKTYVNVHTSKNPNGEIRGQINPVR
jgi:CHRD domain